MRLVLDTNVALSAFLGASAPTKLIELAAEGEIRLFSSPELLAELAEVLGRERILRRFDSKRRSPMEALALYESLVESVPPASISPTSSDPDDDSVLACAVAAGADLIVSGDKALRNLKSFHRIPIVSPVDAVGTVVSRN